MASIGSISGSKFIGTPIVVPVTAGTVESGATFHRVRLVTVINATEFDFSSPAGNGETVQFDISSAFRAVAAGWEPSPEPGGYPHYTLVKLKAYDEYLLNGQEKSVAGSEQGASGAFYQGSLTDRERLTGERPTVYSRKPTSSPEVCFAGNPHLSAGAIGGSPSVNAVNVEGGLQTIGGRQVYGIGQSRDGFELRFINGLGVHENVFVTCLRQTETAIQTDRYTIARPETLTRFSRGLALKHNDHERWKMTSGPLDEKWLQWWLHEPLTARWAWLNVSGQWLPVHVLPEETVAGIDRQKASMMTVDFTLEFDVCGSPYAM